MTLGFAVRRWASGKSPVAFQARESAAGDAVVHDVYERPWALWPMMMRRTPTSSQTRRQRAS